MIWPVDREWQWLSLEFMLIEQRLQCQRWTAKSDAGRSDSTDISLAGRCVALIDLVANSVCIMVKAHIRLIKISK